MTTTDVIMILTFSDGTYAHAFANGFTDTTETEIQLRDIAGTAISVGNGANGKHLRRLEVQCSDGSYAGPLKYIKKDGRVSHTWYGAERNLIDPSDIDVKGFDIFIEQGDVMKITTQD